jgi:hypothetical protein
MANRDPKRRHGHQCPGCRAFIRKDSTICPRCGAELKGSGNATFPPDRKDPEPQTPAEPEPEPAGASDPPDRSGGFWWHRRAQ